MNTHWTILLLYWLAAILPAVPFVMIYLAYRHTLLGKRFTVLEVLSRKGVLNSYLSAFGTTDPYGNKQPATPDVVVDTLFNLYYHWGSYAFGIALNVLVIVAACACILVSHKVPLGLPPALDQLAQKTLSTFAFGFGGAYIWNLYDLVKRYRAVDLTPSSFQFSWLRLLAACIVGPLAALAAADGIKNIVAFGFGILPLQTIFQYFTDYATKRLGIGTTQVPAAGPTLHNLQGMTPDSIERMSEEGIDSVATLAYSDPMKLFLKTDIEWVVIIDVIDQALLFNYVGDKLPALRPAGVRGSIEMAIVYQRLISGKKDDVDDATALIKELAPKLALGETETKNLIRTVWEDGQVELLWDLFGEAFSGDQERGSEETATDEAPSREAGERTESGAAESDSKQKTP